MALLFLADVVELDLIVVLLELLVDGLEPRVTLCVCAEMVATVNSKTKIANMLFILLFILKFIVHNIVHECCFKESLKGKAQTKVIVPVARSAEAPV